MSYQKRSDNVTLDEAIKHAEEVANSKCNSCGAEHRQLANWLKELKDLRERLIKQIDKKEWN